MRSDVVCRDGCRRRFQIAGAIGLSATRCARAAGDGSLWRVAAPLTLLAVAIVMPAVAANGGAETIGIAGSHWIGDAPTKVADALGYFDAERSPASPEAIRVGSFNSGKQALEALLRGEAEFALSATTPVAHAVMARNRSPHASPDDIVVLASIALSSQSHYVLAMRSRGIRAPADLAGKRVGIMFGTATHFGWHQFARLHRIPAHAVTLKNMPVDQLGPGLLAGTVDAIVLWDPWGESIRHRLGADAMEFLTQPVQTVNWLLVARRATVTQHGALVERILRAYLRAIDFIAAEPERAWQIHADATGASLQSLQAAGRRVIWTAELNWSVLANMEAQFEWLHARPGFDGMVRPGPANYLEAGPLSRVAPARVRLPALLYRGVTVSGGRQ